jgi:hypothetical protein
MMENVGIGTSLWWELLKFGVVASIALMMSVFAYRSYKAFKSGDDEKKSAGANLAAAVIMAILLVAAIAYFYFAFGPGKKIETLPAEEQGTHRLVDTYPDEKPVQDIKKEARDKKPEELKRQEEGFEKDAKEADDFVKKALEDADKSKKKKKKKE